jgi:hypothetical protein
MVTNIIAAKTVGVLNLIWFSLVGHKICCPKGNAESLTRLTTGLAEKSFTAELMDKRLFDVQELGRW